MSRSYRKTPIFGNTGCKSEKEDKRIGNRKLRRINKQICQNDTGESVYKIMDEVMNPWSMGKDGRHYWSKEPGCYCMRTWILAYRPDLFETQEEWEADRLQRWKEAMRK